MAKKMGRKPLDPHKYFKRIKKYITDGLSPLQAAKLAGISADTYYKWLDNLPELTNIIENAEAETEHILVKSAVRNALDQKNVPAIVSILEHRYKERWSPKVINELTGVNGDSVVFKVDVSGGYIPPENVMGLTSTLTTLKTIKSKVNTEAS